MNQKYSKAEREHVGRVKALDCSVCGAHAPSQAHHIDQSCNWTVIALCRECHQGKDGWHGTKALWKVYKLDEIKALNITIRRLLA